MLTLLLRPYTIKSWKSKVHLYDTSFYQSFCRLVTAFGQYLVGHWYDNARITKLTVSLAAACCEDFFVHCPLPVHAIGVYAGQTTRQLSSPPPCPQKAAEYPREIHETISQSLLRKSASFPCLWNPFPGFSRNLREQKMEKSISAKMWRSGLHYWLPPANLRQGRIENQLHWKKWTWKLNCWKYACFLVLKTTHTT